MASSLVSPFLSSLLLPLSLPDPQSLNLQTRLFFTLYTLILLSSIDLNTICILMTF